MKEKVMFWLLTVGVLSVWGAGVAFGVWGREYVEFPKIWAQEKAAIQQRFKAEAAEERQQTLLMREMLANQMWDRCMKQEEEDAGRCKVQQDSVRRAWFVQDSLAMLPDTTS